MLNNGEKWLFRDAAFMAAEENERFPNFLLGPAACEIETTERQLCIKQQIA